MSGKPILKWAGGKSKLVPLLRSHLPARIGTYAEPFAGGAALFFAIAGEHRFERAILADRNEELIACYRAVRDEVEKVIRALGAYRYERELYYATRERDTRGMSDVERAARFIFLNRTCFNGLWRVNAEGRFNVPFGRYKNPKILDRDALRRASAALENVEILDADFEEVLLSLKKGDFAYLDPPYVPVSKTSSFTSYASGGFGPSDQKRLARALARLRKRGIRAMLSNADTEETRLLYEPFRVETTEVPRAINSNPTRRGAVGELVVLTWDEDHEPTGRCKLRT